MARILLYNLLRFAALMVLQVSLFKNIGYYNLASPFPYILFILLLPLGTSNFFLFLISFGTGLVIDAFYDSLGVHAAACITLAWFRILFDSITLEVETRQSLDTPSWGELGSKWFLSYIFLGTLIHHITLFTIEVFSFKNFHLTLLSILLSSIFTFLIIMLINLLFYKRKSRLSK